MQKVYVLDTNIILNDNRNVLAFGNNLVVIPNTVIVEVDHKKSLNDELGYHARSFSNLLDNLRTKGKLKYGVPLENGGTLKVVSSPLESTVYSELGEITNDIKIIATAHSLKKQGYDVVLVSNDTNVRIMADEYVEAEKFLNDRAILSEQESYKGYTILNVDESIITILKSTYRVSTSNVPEVLDYPEKHFFILNGFITVQKTDGYLEKTYPYQDGVWDVRPKNPQQEMSMNLLMNDRVPVCTLEGTAGSGKTIMALAAGLEQTLNNKKYNKIIYMKPPLETEFQIGFLPGNEREKLNPHIQPAFDNLEVLFGCKTRKDLDKILQGYEGIINFENIGFMRGRTIPNAYIIVDEAQNLTRHGVKTLLTRLGEGSKMILLGDPKQIDNRFVDQLSNGLTHVIERLKNTEIHGHVSLPKSERSDVSQICADLL